MPPASPGSASLPDGAGARSFGRYVTSGPTSLVDVRALAACLFVFAIAAVGGCGGGGGGSNSHEAPVLGQRGDEKPQGPPLGFPVLATKNTTRVAGADPVADAAAVAQAVYPARTAETRPQAVVLADQHNWPAAIAASQLAGPPVRAPILLTDGNKLPGATKAALDALKPTGAKAVAGAQVIRVGTKADVGKLRTTDVAAGSPAAVAAAVDRLQAAAVGGKPTAAVVVASSDASDYAMPAAGWAAKSGDPVLWTGRETLPPETRAAIARHRRPGIYVLGPPAAVSDAVAAQLSKLGKVRRIAGADPVTTAIAFARYADGKFGWNVTDPGHGVVFASTRRPLDAAAGAPLSASGTYGPLLLVTDAQALPKPVQDYLLDIQPGYDPDPVRGVYNHGWLLGDESAIAAAVQARIDTPLEIQPVDTGGK